MTNIRINTLPNDPAPSATDVTMIDGLSVRKTSLAAIVNAGRPQATQAEAIAGTDAVKAMAPLTVAQAIATQGAAQFATVVQGGKADSAVQPSRKVLTGTGLQGGGDLTEDRTLSLTPASVASLAKADSAVQPARQVATGTGLQGGGDLSQDRTVALSAGSQASLAKADTALQPANIGDTVQAHDVVLDSFAGLQLLPGDVFYAIDANTIGRLTRGLEGEILSISLGVPAWRAVAGTGDMVKSAYDPRNIVKDIFDRANHTGTQDVSTISGLSTTLAAFVKKIGDTMSGALTVAANITALQNFVSSTVNVVLATTGAGTVFLRPQGPASGAGQATLDSAGTFTAATLTSSGNVNAAGAQLQTNGNVTGSIWANFGTADAFTGINNRIETRAAAFADDRRNQCVTNSQMAGFVSQGFLLTSSAGASFENSGFVLTLFQRTGANTVTIGARQPQLSIPNRGGFFAAFLF